MRHLALCLALAFIALAPTAPGRAEAPLPPTPTVLTISTLSDTAEVSLADRWMLRMTEMRERRQRVDTWLIPTLLGGAALAGAATTLFDLAPAARIVTGVSAGIAAAGMIAALVDKPAKKARWFAIAGGLFAVVYGAAGFVDTLARKNDDCTGYCFNEKSIGWLGGGFAAQGLALLPLAAVSRGPSVEELKEYKKLPAHERPARARKLLARIDRDERKAHLLSLLNGMVGMAAFMTGAALVEDRGNRMTLLAFGGITLGTTMLTSINTLLTKPRLERFADSEEPAEKERILW